MRSNDEEVVQSIREWGGIMEEYKTDAEIYAVLERGDHRPDPAAGQQFAE